MKNKIKIIKVKKKRDVSASSHNSIRGDKENMDVMSTGSRIERLESMNHVADLSGAANMQD